MRTYKCTPTAKPQTVATVTQLDSQKVLDPENLARKDNILVIYPNVNNGYSVKPLAAIQVKEAAGTERAACGGTH